MLGVVFCIMIANGQYPTKRVFFIGNSLTSTNDLPSLLREVGNAPNSIMRFTTEENLPGGSFLRYHADKNYTLYTGALDQIHNGGWDFVVLQEQSGFWDQLNIPNYQMWPDILATATKNINAYPVFLSTWPEQNVADYSQKLIIITDAYSQAADRNNAYCAPCGDALFKIRQEKGANLVYIDNIHPTYTAQVLNAYVLYSTLTGSSPVGLCVNFNVYNNTQLQHYAWDTYTMYRRKQNDFCTIYRKQGAVSCVQFFNDSTPLFTPVCAPKTDDPVLSLAAILGISAVAVVVVIVVFKCRHWCS